MADLKLVIFDMDGLLIDSERWSIKTFEKIAEQMGYEADLEVFCQGMGQKQHKEIYRCFKGAKKEDEKQLEKEVMEFLEKEMAGLYEEGCSLRPGVRKILDYFKEEKIDMAVASSSSIEKVSQLIAKAKIDPYFRFYVTAQDIDQGKPDPEIFLKACKKARVETNEALVFEDSQNGAMAACRAKIPFVLVPDIAYLSEEMKEKALCVVERIDDAIAKVNESCFRL